MKPWKLLRVNLTNRTSTTEEIDEKTLRKLLGGRTLGAYYLLKEVSAEIDPLGEENKLIITTGLLTRTKVSGASRYSIIAKSPLTNGFGESEAGGWWGPALVAAGFNMLIIEGKAENPIYLSIHNEKLDFHEADDIWGKGNKETYQILREIHPHFRVLQIGPAGENQVRYASIVNEIRHANGRCGLGAVMGSKNLKAIVVKGENEPEIADEEGFNEFRDWHNELILNSFYGKYFRDHGTPVGFDYANVTGGLPTRNFSQMTYENAAKISSNVLEKEFLKGHGTCYGCLMRCKPVAFLKDKDDGLADLGGPEYETMGALGSMCAVQEMSTVIQANALASDLSLDSISLGNSIAFLMECYEKEIQVPGAPEDYSITFGDDQGVLELIQDIAYRRGIGDFAAKGVKYMAEVIGSETHSFAMHVKGQEFPMHDPRTKLMQSLAYAVNPAGADHNTTPMDDMFSKKGAFLKLAAQLGILDPVAEAVLDERKVQLYHYLSLERALYNTLMLCIFVGSPTMPVSLNDLTGLVQSVSGWDISSWELLKISEKGLILAQLFNIGCGLTDKENILPERMYEEIPSGPKVGRKVDRAQFQKMKKIYYGMLGWDENAIPQRSKLAELGLFEFIEEVKD